MVQGGDNTFLASVLRWMRARPDRAFSHFITPEGEETTTWGALHHRTAGYAEAYRAAVPSGEGVVLIFLRHTPDLYSSFLGAMFAGLVPSFMPCTSPRQDPQIYWSSHRQLLAIIRPVAVVADADTFSEMDAAGLDLGQVARITPT